MRAEFLTASEGAQENATETRQRGRDTTRLGTGPPRSVNQRQDFSDACSVKSSATRPNEKPRNRLIRFVWPLQRGATSQPRSVEGLSL